MKVVTVVGARPQFVKAAAVSRAIASESSGRLSEVLVHTGQHYDENMSGVFFDELGIPPPAHNLEISGGSHGAMTGRMLEAVEKVLLAEKPDWLLIYGDTNSTLAGALAAAKLQIPVAHVEAGLRSFNMRMPEEVNRILSDRVSSLHFCPTSTAVLNLAAEGMSLVGPRPCLPSQTELIAARERLGVYAVRPGITGLAQVSGIDMSTPELLAQTDAQMIRTLSLRHYLRYLLQTTVAGGGRGDAIRN